MFLRVAHEHEELGGDFYDIHGEDDDLTVLLGDVAGKGVEAAVHAKRIRNAVRTASHVDRDPAWILGLVNRVLTSEAEDLSEVISTAVCARLRPGPDTLAVEIANAGHPPALVLRVRRHRRDGHRRGRRAGAARRHDVHHDDAGAARRRHAALLHRRRHRGARVRGHVRRRAARGRAQPLGGVKASAVVDQVAIAVTSHIAHRQRDDIALVALRYLPDHG